MAVESESLTLEDAPARGSRLLRWIEVVGNRLPHPFMMFVWMTLTTMALSALLAALEISVVHPGTGKEVLIRSLFSREGVGWIVTHVLTNFTAFRPLGLVLTMMMGIGLAEKTGLIQTSMRTMLLRVPAFMMTFMVVMTGIVGNLASDAAFVVIPPLAALAFRSVGRHPVAGLVAGFAGVSSGFTANIFVSGTDALLSGITTEAAVAIQPDLAVTPVANWYFMVSSVFMLSLIGVFVTEKIVVPRLAPWKEEEGAPVVMEDLSPAEKSAMRWTGVAALLFIAAIAAMLIPEDGLLRDPVKGTIIPSPFLKGIVPVLVAFFVLVSTVYGYRAGKIKEAADVPRMMGESLSGMAGFIVLVFMVAQFIAFFNWSNMGVWVAVNGAEFLQASHITGIPLIVGFVLVTAVLNLVIVSGSAQWALMAPVFVPMLMVMGYHPAVVQLAFRIADSSTNSISPLNVYLPILLAFMQKYDKRAGLGNLISLMIPYSALFLLTWTVMLVVWMFMGWDVGVDSPILLP